jgi:hypothetical protein
MRKRFEAQQEQPSGTVREQILQEGIAGVAPPPPQMMGAMGMPQQAPMPRQQPPMQPPQMPPQQSPMPQQGAPMPPPMGMSNGGVVRMATRGEVPYSRTGRTLEETLQNLYNYNVGANPNIRRPASGVNIGDLSSEELADLMTVNPAPTAVAGVNIGNLPPDDLPLTKSDMDNVVSDVNDSGAVKEDTDRVLTGNTNLTSDLILTGLSQKSFIDKTVEDRMKDIVGPNYDDLINKANNLIGNVPAVDEDDTTVDMFSTMPSPLDVARVNVEKPDLGELVAPSYGKIIEAQEQRLKKIREDAKRDIGAQALIQLGAGIAAGDVSTGLSEAGKAAAEERKRQRDAEDQITSLQTQIQMAQEQGKFDVAKALRDEQLNLYKMDVDLEKDYLSRSRDAYEYDAALQKGIIEFNKEFGQSVAEFDAELDQAVNEYNLKIDEMGLDIAEEEGLRLRARAKAQQDIVLRILPDPTVSEEEKKVAVDNLKETLQLLKEPFSVSMPSKIPTRQTGSVPDTSGMSIERG